MKKSIFLLLASCASIFLSVFSSYAQHQRLGIQPQEIVLDAKDSKLVEAYCFDRHVIIDDNTYDYRYLQTDESAIQVFVGGKRYSFSKAIEENKIKVSARPGDKSKGEPEIVIEIRKLVPDRVIVNVAKTSVFRDAPGTYKNQKALDILNSLNASSGTTSIDRQSIQDPIWTADIDRTRLESLGYKSKDDFLTIHRLSRNTPDDRISAILEAEEDALIERFEAVYIFASRNDTQVQSVSDNIRNLQQLYGVKETGVYGDDVNALLNRYVREYLPVVKEVAKLSLASDSYLLRVKSVIGDDRLYTVYTPFGAFRLNNIGEMTEFISDLSKDNKGIFLDLEFPSPEKVEAFRTSLNIANNNSVTMIEGTPAARGKFFNSGNVTEVVSSSPVEGSQDVYRSTLTYKTETEPINQEVTVAAKVKQTVVKFVQTFRSLVNGKRNVASIASEARRKSGSVTLGFGEVERIHIIKLFPNRLVEVAAE